VAVNHPGSLHFGDDSSSTSVAGHGERDKKPRSLAVTSCTSFFRSDLLVSQGQPALSGELLGWVGGTGPVGGPARVDPLFACSCGMKVIEVVDLGKVSSMMGF
jgi:hypothetical protein